MNSDIKKYLKEEKETHITEWGVSTQYGNLINDTCFASSFIVSNILQCIGKVNSIGHWIFTDLMEEAKLPREEFHGGFGLMTYNGIKKPSYFAYYILNKLGNEIIEQSEGYIVTRKNEDIQILTYNYTHFDDLFMNGDFSALSYKKRYMIFKEKAANEIYINIKELYGYYKVTKYKLDRENGSSYDNWIRMGSPEDMGNEEIDYLKSTSNPKITVEYLDLDGSYKDKIYTQVHGVDLIVLEKKFK